MLRVLGGKTRRDEISNEKNREMTGVENMKDFKNKYCDARVDNEKGPVKALTTLEIGWFKKRYTKEEIGRGGEARYDFERITENGCTRLHNGDLAAKTG